MGVASRRWGTGTNVIDRSTAAAGLLGLIGVLAPLAGRPLALLTPLAIGLAVAALLHRSGSGVSRTALATFIGLVPALVLLGVIHDLLGIAPPLPVSALLLLALWATTARTLGTAVADRVEGRWGAVDVWGRILGVAVSTTVVAGALVRLLLPRYTTADRLAWTLGEEDNAQIVGIAREVLAGGPRGAELADQYGTAFINLPLVLLRLVGGGPASETDVRLQAITVFTFSTIVAIVLAGLAMALIAALPHHVHASERGRRVGPAGALAGAAASSIATLIGLSLLVVLPMRTGFLTFVWGLTFVLLGAALVLVTPHDAPTSTRIVLVAHLAALVVLLLSSWPFIAPAIAPLLLVPLLWIRWPAVRASMRRHRARWLTGTTVALVAVAAVAYWFSRWGPAAEVLSYGLDILLIGASGIGADPLMHRVAVAAIATAAALAVALARSGARLPSLLGIVGPVAGGGALYLGLRTAAALLTDGQLNYAGIKLFYGIVTLAVVVGLAALTSQSTRLGALGPLAVLAVVVLVHQASPTASLHTTWWERTYLGPQQHAEATVDAIRRTTPDVPIRCLPSAGTPVTSRSQWAAYWCVRWMEDAFNEGRFGGHRERLLTSGGDTFEETVAAILADSPSDYLFAHRFTMGPGWFGWSGRDD